MHEHVLAGACRLDEPIAFVGLNHFTVPVAILVSNVDHSRYSPRSSVPRGNTGGLAALEKFLIGRTMIAIGRDARVLKKFVEPAANCVLYTTE